MLTFDCEGKWGMTDCLAARHGRLFTTRNLESTYRALAKLLARYQIPTTMAFTAAFTMAPELFERMRPEVQARTRGAEAWISRAMDQIERDGGDGWFAPACLQVVRASRRHEIASHGFSHLPWHALYAKRPILDAELSLTRKVPGFDSEQVTTFVYPRNQVAHPDLLAAHGFIAYRESIPTRTRAGNYAAEFGFLPKSGRIELQEQRPVGVPAGLFLNWRHGLRRMVPAAVTVRRCRHLVQHAMRTGGVAHLWSHPENFLDGEDMLPMLERILEFAAQERDAGRLQVLTTSEFVAMHLCAATE